MKKEASSVQELQNALQSVITQPSGALAEDSVVKVDSLVQSNMLLSAVERVNIYHRSYYERLLSCFQAEFPCLEYTLGVDLFRAFAFGFLQKYPSNSYTLFKLCERFPAFLEENRPDAHLPVEERENWPSFLVELAILERTINEVYIAKNAPPLSWKIKFEFPVYAYFTAWRAEEKPVLPAPQEELLLIYREKFVVKIRAIDILEYELS